MALTIGILIFDDAEELDFVGPWEVFTSAARLGTGIGAVVTIAAAARAITCAKGMRVIPDHHFADAPPLDVVLVPGGQGTRREIHNPALVAWLRAAGAACTWVTSVCTGAALLHAAGFTRGKRVTTHWGFIESLRAMGEVTVLERVRYVRDGNLVTAAGVSAGVDMALWLVGQLESVDLARRVQRQIEYEPAPPYAAEA